MMSYEMWEIWMAVRRFLIGWGLGLGILFVASCIKYRAFIGAAFANHMSLLVNGMMPVLIILFGIGYILKQAFR